MQEQGRLRRRMQERGPERLLLIGLLQALERATLRQRERRLGREEERGLVRSEDLHRLQVLSKLDERWPKREQYRGSLRRLERQSFPVLLERPSRVQERGPYKRLVLPQGSGERPIRKG